MSDDAVLVHKDRTTRITVSLGMDVSDDTITSQIRTKSGELIVDWTVEYDSDGTDGELILTIDNALTSDITAETGEMDFKRMSAGEPLAIIAKPIEVQFVKAVTI
jgi:hypothetical protein